MVEFNKVYKTIDDMDTITVWKDGSSKQWSDHDGYYSESNEDNWLATISIRNSLMETKFQTLLDAVDRIHNFRMDLKPAFYQEDAVMKNCENLILGLLELEVKRYEMEKREGK